MHSVLGRRLENCHRRSDRVSDLLGQLTTGHSTEPVDAADVMVSGERRVLDEFVVSGDSADEDVVVFSVGCQHEIADLHLARTDRALLRNRAPWRD